MRSAAIVNDFWKPLFRPSTYEENLNSITPFCITLLLRCVVYNSTITLKLTVFFEVSSSPMGLTMITVEVRRSPTLNTLMAFL